MHTLHNRKKLILKKRIIDPTKIINEKKTIFRYCKWIFYYMGTRQKLDNRNRKIALLKVSAQPNALSYLNRILMQLNVQTNVFSHRDFIFPYVFRLVFIQLHELKIVFPRSYFLFPNIFFLLYNLIKNISISYNL